MNCWPLIGAKQQQQKLATDCKQTKTNNVHNCTYFRVYPFETWYWHVVLWFKEEKKNCPKETALF